MNRSTLVRWSLVAGSAALTAATLTTNATAQAAGCNNVYTLNGDFDGGVLFNVNHDIPDQLQLNTVAQPFPFVNIACSARGTIVRIDVNTGVVLGEYFTAPNGMGRDPSRTTVDRLGNVWVSNRAEGGVSGGVSKGSVTRVGLVIGGTRGIKDINGNFQPDPNGEYLQPPFLYATCVDRDGDGLIRTSRGLTNILPWTNAGGVDTHGGVATAEDECIINYTRIVGTNARTVAIDAANDVWTGGLSNQAHEKLDGVTGQPVGGTQFNIGGGGYGGFVDGAGILWSSRGGSGLIRFDPSSMTGSALGNGCGDYGLGIDPQTGNVWHSGLFTGTTSVRAPDGTCLGAYPHGNSGAQGVCVDGSSNVWVAHSLLSGYTTVGHLRTDGLFVGNVPLPGGSGPTGVAVDSNGKIWVACYYSNNAMRIDPAAGAIGGGGFPVGAVDLVVNLGAGANPYNYSDMTGFVSIGTTAQSGTWSVVQDSSTLGQEWGTICWTSSEPAGTSVVVEARASDSAILLPTLPWTVITNCVSSCGTNTLVGQFVEIRATLSRLPNVNATPILFDLSAQCCNLGPALECPADVTEIWSDPVAQTDPNHTGWASFSPSQCPGGMTLTYSDVSVPNTVQNPGAPELCVTRTWRLSDACGLVMECDQKITLLSPSGLLGLLTLDVEPGTCPNDVWVTQPSASTTLAVAGTWNRDVALIAPNSLRIARADSVGHKLNNLPIAFSDITQPYYQQSGPCSALGADGHGDLVITLSNSQMIHAFELNKVATGAQVELVIVGKLVTGERFEATDWLTVQR